MTSVADQRPPPSVVGAESKVDVILPGQTDVSREAHLFTEELLHVQTPCHVNHQLPFGCGEERAEPLRDEFPDQQRVLHHRCIMESRVALRVGRVNIHALLDEELAQLGVPVQDGELEAAQSFGSLGVDVGAVSVQEAADGRQLAPHYSSVKELVLHRHERTAENRYLHAATLLLTRHLQKKLKIFPSPTPLSYIRVLK